MGFLDYDVEIRKIIYLKKPLTTPAALTTALAHIHCPSGL